MKVIVIGDPHFKTSDIDECVEMAKSIIETTSKSNPDFIVVLGDTLDRFESIHVSPLRQSTEFLLELTHIAPVYLLIGNHDRPNPKTYQSNEHPFNSLKHWDNMTVIEEARGIEIDDCYFIFAPYYYPGLFAEKVNHLVNDKLTAIFSHQEFRGVNMSGNISTSSDVVIPSYNLVINGHIHEYQELDRLICVGTPRQIAFNESFPKTISLFDFNGRLWKQTRLTLDITQKITLTLNVNEVTKYVPEEKSKVKIVVEGTIDEIRTLMKGYKCKYSNVKIVYRTIMPTFVSDTGNSMITKRSFKDHLLEVVRGSELEDAYKIVFG